ncbi:MAG: hypothetical protein ACOXZI_06605 [Candidatus Cryptobacteroides sp.]|jgi:hypothetical protein
MKKTFLFFFAVCSILLVSCGKENSTKIEAPETNEVEASTEHIISIRGIQAGRSVGVWVEDKNGELLSQTCLKAEENEKGDYNCSIVLENSVLPSKIVCFSPYIEGLTSLNGAPTLVIPSGFFGNVEPAQVLTASSELSNAGVANQWSAQLTFVPMLHPATVSVEGLNDSDKIYSISLKCNKHLSGKRIISELFQPAEGSSEFSYSVSEGTVERTFEIFSTETLFRADEYYLLTQNMYYEGTCSEGNINVALAKTTSKSMSFDLIGADGKVTGDMSADGISLTSSGDNKQYFFGLSNASVENGHGIILSGDELAPGSFSFPSIEEQQITRVITVLDPSFAQGIHTVWLESYMGSAWDKIDRTEKLVSAEGLANDGCVLEFVLPKNKVSTSSVYRIFNGIGNQDICIRSVSITHEDETCSHHPMSIIEDGYKTGWSACGTSANLANNFDPKQLIKVDSEVSHVDDGSGSLLLEAPDCINNFKPWIGWRYKDTPVVGGATYRIYFCIKTENMPAYASLFLSMGFKNSAKQWLTGWVPGAPTANNLNASTSLWVDKEKGTHDWMKLSAEITAPEDAVTLSYFQFMLQSIISAPGAKVWFDDVNMVRVK